MGSWQTRPGLPEEERDRHKAEARRWYDQAVKQIDGVALSGRDPTDQAIRAFRAEAAESVGSRRETEVSRKSRS